MFKTIFLALSLVLSVSAKAITINEVASKLSQTILSDMDMQSPFNWAVGDTAKYNLNGGIIKGTMTMTIKAVSSTELVIEQAMDLGFMGKQACEMTLNPQTGELLKMVCNGQNQNPGDQGTVEVVESKEDNVTVPAGTFACLYLKIKQTSQGKESIAQQWVNPKLVPVMGMIKAITPTPIGDMTMELASFKKM